MASYSIDPPATSRSATLTAGQVDTVTVNRWGTELVVMSLDGAGEIYFTTNGTAPTFADASSEVVPAVIHETAVDLPSRDVTVLKLVSDQAVRYRVVIR